MDTIWQAIIHTPWWVFLLLIFLIKRGIQATQTRIIPFKKIIIFPIIITFISLHTLITSFSISINIMAIWLYAALIGTIGGYLQIYQRELRVDKKHWLIQQPGSWTTLILILIVFISKYYFGYMLAVQPQIITNSGFKFSLLAISGITSGIFIGRLICYLHRLFTLESINLATKISKV